MATYVIFHKSSVFCVDVEKVHVEFMSEEVELCFTELCLKRSFSVTIFLSV